MSIIEWHIEDDKNENKNKKDLLFNKIKTKLSEDESYTISFYNNKQTIKIKNKKCKYQTIIRDIIYYIPHDPKLLYVKYHFESNINNIIIERDYIQYRIPYNGEIEILKEQILRIKDFIVCNKCY